jgi:S-DNA-T family DNA segregation ATPase FtsK/SpoIIIE
LALTLLAAALFLAAALASYDPADPVTSLAGPFGWLYRPDVVTYPQNPQSTNICGRWGAAIADVLLTALGAAVWYVVASLAAVALVLFRRDIQNAQSRALGWMLSLGGVATCAALLPVDWAGGPLIGVGGYLGALGSASLEAHFATAGSLILAVSVTLAGLLLCTDDALWRIALKSMGLSYRATRSTGRVVLRRRPAVASQEDGDEEASAEEADGEESAEDEESAIPVRRRRRRTSDLAAPATKKRAARPAVEEDSEGGEEESEESDEEESPPIVKKKSKGRKDPESPDEDPVVTTRIDPPLKLRKPHKLDPAERDEVREALDEGSQAAEASEYQLPDINLLIEGDEFSYENQEQEVLRKAKILEETFASFGFNVKVVEIETGPVIAQYEIELEAGLRLSKITGLADDLAIALRVPSVRIVAPIPGKNTVGIEVPNEQRQVVRLREVMEEAGPKAAKMRIPLFLGKDVAGNPLITDLSTLPHLLIAGRTGTGKSVCLNAIINSILMTKGPDEVRMLMIDPKMVELSGYATLPHLMHPVVTDMKKAEAILAWAVDKMEERYALLAKAGVRHICSYNQLGEEELYERLEPEDEEQKKDIPTQLPFIVIVADEIADLMMQAGKEVEQHIIRLAQKSRAVGIHLILATQKPTVDVITGLIKSNLPAPWCSTKWAPTSSWGTATCSSSGRGPARSFAVRGRTLPMKRSTRSSISSAPASSGL